MIYIAHRGNINGPNPELENHPDYIQKALNSGLDVEVDVWHYENNFYLGHDMPQYKVENTFLLNAKFWHHAKNIEALYKLNAMNPNYLINCFFHNTDDATLTSGGWIWTYPGKILTKHSIAVLPEIVTNWDIAEAYGICTDFPDRYICQK